MRRVLALTTSLLLLSGCAAVPADPQGTLERVSGGTLNVGVSPNGDFAFVSGDAVTGSEAALVEAFADTVDADVEWTVGSEEALVRALEREDVDLVIGGLTDATPWADKAGVTRPYGEFTDEDGKTHKLVMLVPMGENAFLTRLETFLTHEAAGSR